MSKKADIKVGVLAIQGDVLEHVEMMNEVLTQKNIKSKTILVKRPEQLKDLDGLIIPGGESTVMSRLGSEARFTGKLIDTIRQKAKDGMAIFGTCAGTIMLSKKSTDNVVNGFSQEILEVMDIEVIRNRYGRQQDSFEMDLQIQGFSKQSFPGVFIRAPIITKAGKNVEILCRNEKGIYAAREGKLLATTFHPELTNDTRFHEYFLNMILS